MFDIIKTTLSSDSFLLVNKSLMKVVGINGALVYASLVHKAAWYKENSNLKDGWFFSTAEDLKESTLLSRYQQDRAIDSLVKTKLLFTKTQGMPARRWFKVNEDMAILSHLIKSSKEKSEVNLKTSFKETNKQVSKKLENKIARNLKTSFKETNKQVLKKLESKNNNIKIINKNNNTLSSRSSIKELIQEWNKLDIRPIRHIKENTNRYKLLSARISEYGYDAVIEAIRNVNHSSFLKGQNKRGWTIDFDWFIKPNNFIKVYENRYKDGEGITNGITNTEYGW